MLPARPLSNPTSPRLCPLTVDRSKIKTLAAETGATAASSLRELAQSSASIITMLPNTPNVEAIYLGNPAGAVRENARDTSRSPTTEAAMERGGEVGVGGDGGGGLLDFARPGTLVVDSSTIDPLASRRVNAMATRKVSRRGHQTGAGGGWGSTSGREVDT